MPPISRALLWKRLRRNLTWIGLLILVWLLCSGQAAAETLTERQQHFPNWQQKPTLEIARGDLAYPGWFAGTWRLTTTLVDMAAPLAPALTTPGFEGNRQFLDRPIAATVRFVPAPAVRGQIVADRAYNGLSLARAYLGKGAVNTVRVDPDNPNRQITFLYDRQQLVSTVTGRRIEAPNAASFATTELFQQYFRNAKDADDEPTTYLNEVENTTVYRKSADPNFPIVADQMTAIYLSPQDPDYFKAKGQPVALYRYQLSFSPVLD